MATTNFNTIFLRSISKVNKRTTYQFLLFCGADFDFQVVHAFGLSFMHQRIQKSPKDSKYPHCTPNHNFPRVERQVRMKIWILITPITTGSACLPVHQPQNMTASEKNDQIQIVVSSLRNEYLVCACD